MLENKFIGLFGGAFDPVHKAHIEIAENIHKFLNLNKIIFIPTGISPFNKNLTDYNHRIAMLNLVCLNKNFEVSDIEIIKSITSNEKSYTVDTLKYLFENNNDTYFFILGSDTLSHLSDWYKWKDIIKYSHLIFVERKGSLLKDCLSEEIKNFVNSHKVSDIKNLKQKRSGLTYQFKMNFMDISSTEVVNENINNSDITKLVPEAVNKYIKKHQLYL
tara:strand:+ start:3506 stop:4156 length:651 start_codon:yes stop_codon:yes gene_type:complete